jgi:predicted membrane-bound mannosyltransferase
MTPKRPPVIATWLLRNLGCSPNNEAVLGDLAEEFLRKGATWYWRQALKAIPVSALREVRGHKWLAVRAVVVAFVVWTAFIGSELTLSYFLPPGPHPSFDLVQASRQPIGGAGALLYEPVFKGFLLEHSNPVVFVLWIQILLPLMVWALIGWIVARVDIRNYRRDLVVIFACWMAVVHLVLIGPAISYMVGLGASHLVIPIAAYAATSIAAILLGGSLHRPQSERCADAV